MKLFVLFLSFACLGETWVINKDHSEIMFQVPYMGVSELTGRFNEYSGEYSGNELEVKIDSRSIDTGNKMRDGHLKGADFFQSGEYPFILFKSKKITEIKPGIYDALGDLSIKGISRPTKIQFSITQSVKDTWGYENKFVKFRSAINRKDYKITWNKTLDGQQFLVGDLISFYGTFQLQPYKAKTPNSKHMIPDTSYIRERDESFISRKLRSLINGKDHE